MGGHGLEDSACLLPSVVVDHPQQGGAHRALQPRDNQLGFWDVKNLPVGVCGVCGGGGGGGGGGGLSGRCKGRSKKGLLIALLAY